MNNHPKCYPHNCAEGHDHTIIITFHPPHLITIPNDPMIRYRARIAMYDDSHIFYRIICDEEAHRIICDEEEDENSQVYFEFI
jgi:hypothetical protein